MKCPSCAVELESRLKGRITVDECPQCGGGWFEDDELRQAKDEADLDLVWMDFDLWSRWDSLELQPRDLACPGCGRNLVMVRYGETEIEVDCCPECQGTWLEGGEFEKIIDALTTELLTKPPSEYLVASLREAKEIVTGPESVLSEWKDFTTVIRMMQYRLLAENPRIAKALSQLQAAGQF